MLSEEYDQGPESHLIFEKIAEGDLAYVTEYIARRADLEVCGPDGNNLLFHSIFCDRNEIVEILIPAVSLEQVANTFVLLSGLNHHALLHKLFPLVEESKTDLIDALLTACKFNRTDNIKFLLDSGKVTVFDQDKEGKTPLMWAGGAKATDLLELLLSKGSDINHKDTSGNSVLKIAFSGLWKPLSDTYAPDFAKIEWLLDNGAAISDEDFQEARNLGNKILIGMIADQIEKRENYADINAALHGITLEDIDSPMSDDNTTCTGDVTNEHSEL